MHTKTILLRWGGRLALAGLGLGFAGLLFWLLLTLFPGLLPPERPENQTLDVRYTEIDGDLFSNLPGQVKPPENPALLTEYTLKTDNNGFRIPVMALDHYDDYPIMVVGDSFTDAWMVEFPWPDVLARELDTPVLNLAFRGYGPLEYEEVVKDYGDESHQWLLMGFFEGNDLQNISSTLNENEGNPLTNLVRDAIEPESSEIIESPDGNYRYPLALYIGANFYELAFYDSYIWVLNAEQEIYTQSQNLRIFEETLQDIQAVNSGVCVGVVYIPDKSHIYFPYTEPFGRRWILEHGLETFLTAEDWLDYGAEQEVDFDTLVGRMNNQRDAVQEVVEDTGLTFIDLTTAFQEHAAQGEMLYMKYDTHWNQAGHDLAGAVVADTLRQRTDCSSLE